MSITEMVKRGGVVAVVVVVVVCFFVVFIYFVNVNVSPSRINSFGMSRVNNN
jgi:hypothetical protein